MDMATTVGWASLAIGTICALSALVLAFKTASKTKAVTEAVEQAADRAKATANEADAGTFQAQAGPLSTTLEAVAKLAAALKDLDRVGQLLSVSLGFFAIAGVVAGLEEVAQAISK